MMLCTARSRSTIEREPEICGEQTRYFTRRSGGVRAGSRGYYPKTYPEPPLIVPGTPPSYSGARTATVVVPAA